MAGSRIYRCACIAVLAATGLVSSAQQSATVEDDPDGDVATESISAKPESTNVQAAADLPEAPTPNGVAFRVPALLSEEEVRGSYFRSNEDVPIASQSTKPISQYGGREPFHWKGLLLQSFAFDMLQNATRVMTAGQHDRHILLNKPFWSDYWASLGQFNMRRWNDGDSFKVNYIGHPMEGAIAGYIEVQNDPRGRSERMGDGRAYWVSRERAFWWSLLYSTQWEIGPIGETSIFNQGGFTYPIRCDKDPASPNYCKLPTATYTNNTGWVDFIVTPIVGTLLLIGEDTIDRYITDPLVEKHPRAFGYKVMRSGLNPTRSLANMLRGRYPWYRDYEHPAQFESPVVEEFERATRAETEDHVDLFLHYNQIGVGIYEQGCNNCRTYTTGAGVGVGAHLRPYMDFYSDLSVQPGASPRQGLNVGGSLTTAVFGLRTGYSAKWAAVSIALAPGFASWSDAVYSPSPVYPNPGPGRNFNFATVAELSGDLRTGSHLAFRVSVSNMLIRYKSPDRDPPGIGTPPSLSFLSHDNYINSTNWGMKVGPVLRF
jgi:hypothetical protein